MTFLSLLTLPALGQSDRLRVVKTLGENAKRWLNPQDPIRREAVTALQVSTGFKAEMIEQAIVAAFSELTENKILDYVASEPAFQSQPESAPVSVLHVLAGNVFTAWLPGAVTTLLLGSACHLKPASREPVFTHAWKRSLERIDKALAEKIHIVRWNDSYLKTYPAVVAYGSDETLAVLRGKFDKRARFIAYGHKVSVGIISKEALALNNRTALLTTLLEDIQPFHLEGCLSPRTLYLEGGDASLLEPILPDLKVVPVCKTFHAWNEVVEDLKTYQPYLSAVGYAGTLENAKTLWSDLAPLGVSRICSVGKMQRPPLTWRNGGMSLVQELTKPVN